MKQVFEFCLYGQSLTVKHHSRNVTFVEFVSNLVRNLKSLLVIATAAKGGSDEMRKYPSPAYISYLTSFKRMGVPAPNGKWWGHRREKRAGQKFMDSR